MNESQHHCNCADNRHCTCPAVNGKSPSQHLPGNRHTSPIVAVRKPWTPEKPVRIRE
jgi:hypothetical protein